MKLDATAFAMVSVAHGRSRLRLKPDPLRGAAPPQAGLAVDRCTEAISTCYHHKKQVSYSDPAWAPSHFVLCSGSSWRRAGCAGTISTAL